MPDSQWPVMEALLEFMITNSQRRQKLPSIILVWVERVGGGEEISVLPIGNDLQVFKRKYPCN